MVHLIKKISKSRIGQLFFVINTIFLVYAFASRGPYSFHFHYESLLTKTVVIANLPGLIVSGVLAIPITYLRSLSPSLWWLQLVIDSIGFVCVSVQWWLTGYCLQRLILRTRISRSGA